MTGPDLPRPVPGSNGIGGFTIGVSPIGDIPLFDFWDTVVSQYANSPRLIGLIQNFAEAMDQTENMSAFFDAMFNVLTATGYGLDVWGRIVGVIRTLQVAGGISYFGFAEAGASTFGQEAFASGASATANYSLPDTTYRTLILAKMAYNLSDGSIQSINSILLALFPGRGNCYATDGLDMTMTYTFAFQLTTLEIAIVSESGVLPKPVGVAATVVNP